MIRESWENILLEMDTKLAGYAAANPPGTVAADFMELLLFGVFSPELEFFLCKDMTDKGLKRCVCMHGKSPRAGLAAARPSEITNTISVAGRPAA